jgi:hypothetical protein
VIGSTSIVTISRKRKRSIVVDGEEYLWWVVEDDTPPFVPSRSTTLKVVSVDGELMVDYPLGQEEDLCFVVVLGKRFRAVSGCGGPWRRFRCPLFCPELAVTPACVAELVRWATSRGPDPVEVNYRGLAVP